MDTSNRADIPDRPPSPWLRKYGGWSDSVLANPKEPIRHSGIAPLVPSLDPTYFASFPEEKESLDVLRPLLQPSDRDLDMLVATEQEQIEYNMGLATWEAVLLAEHLADDVPGGHKPTDRGSHRTLAIVNVDESSWHPIFTKEKRYDLRQPILDKRYFPNGARAISAGDAWSVDVPRVWSVVSRALELANRWFRCMATAPWLNHMFYEERVEWVEAEPSAEHLSSPEALSANGKVFRIPAEGSAYDSEQTLRDMPTWWPRGLSGPLSTSITSRFTLRTSTIPTAVCSNIGKRELIQATPNISTLALTATNGPCLSPFMSMCSSSESC